jgi:hypothetical protein
VLVEAAPKAAEAKHGKTAAGSGNNSSGGCDGRRATGEGGSGSGGEGSKFDWDCLIAR